MPRRKRLVVVNVTLQSDRWDYDERVSLAGRDFRLIGSARAEMSKRPRIWCGNGH